MNRAAFLRGLVIELAAARGDCSRGSIVNCHAVGLHSIVLREAPMVRMFVTTPDHDLWRVSGGIPSSIAFHSHQTDLRLETVRGGFSNWMLKPVGTYGFSHRLHGFRWDSKIIGGAGRFSAVPDVLCGKAEEVWIGPGFVASMGSAEIHTVDVPRRERTAWLVTEGARDPNYSPVSYSMRDLTKFDPIGLYRPMMLAEANHLIAWATE